MKKKIFLAVVLILTLMLSLVACKPKGQKEVQNLKVLEGIKAEYQLNETPDFSGIRVLVTYNDGTTKEIGYDDLSVPPTLDTSVAGDKKVTITYENKSVDVNVTVKGKQVAPAAVLTGIEYQSGLPSEIFETEDKFDTILLKVIATYSDGTEGYVNSDALTTNLGDLDFTTAGKKTVVITYQGKTCEHVITVKTVEIAKIEVDSESIDTVVEAGGTLDISGIKVYAVYNNGERKIISNADPDLDLTSGMPDLSVQGNKNYVITYKSFSCTLIISTEPPTLEAIELNTSSAPKKILIGDKLSTGSVTATAILSNNTTCPLPNSVLNFTYDVSKVGTTTVTVKYTTADVTKTATYDVKVLGIQSVAIDTNSIKLNANLNSTYNTDDLVLIVTDEEGSKHQKHIKDGEITVDTSRLDLTTVGNDNYISASFRGVKSADVLIVVVDGEYFITGVALPEALTKWLQAPINDPAGQLKAMKEHFKVMDRPYVVGDDNPFYFSLIISAYDENMEKVTIDGYTSHSEVYLADSATPLSGDELAYYVSIDESTNAFQFTKNAIGKSFKLVTRPAHGVAGFEEECTRSFVVTVVDGYNVYKAWELNYLTNWNDFDFSDVNQSETRSQVEIVHDYLTTERQVANIPTGLNGMVIHGNIYITPDDIPKEYFLDSDRANELYDTINVFSHMATAANPNFTFYGNYFTVNSNALPPVCAPGTGNQEDIVSNAQLFAFSVDYDLKWTGVQTTGTTDADATITIPYDHTKYSTTLRDVFFRDDNPTSNTPADSPRRMRGLIGLKTWAQIVNIDNARYEAFYISYLPDSDFQTVNITDSIFYNSWQNHLFVWSDNPYHTISGSNPDPDFTVLAPYDGWVYPVLTVNTARSSFTKSGGPTIISQVNLPQYKNASKYCGPQINLDATTEDLWTYVTGTEAWFQAMGTTNVGGIEMGILENVALSIKAMNAPLNAACGGSFVTLKPGHEDISGGEFMNIIYANLAAGMDLNQTLKGTEDLDGKLTIGGIPVVDMTDTNGFGYANMIVGMMKSHPVLGQAPIFVSSEGGVGFFDGAAVQTNIYSTFVGAGAISADELLYMAGVAPEQIAVMTVEMKTAAIQQMDAQNKALLGQGDYITLYYNNMGILLQYNLDKDAE